MGSSTMLDDELLRRLVTAIETDTLMFICGAGVSMPAPSNLPSARDLSNRCFDDWSVVEQLNVSLRDNIDRLAAHFHARGEFEQVFVNKLVPWDTLVGDPNDGHAALADMLLCRAAQSALSTNVDTLIEQWAWRNKADLRASFNSQDAVRASAHSPLVKIHGCMNKDRPSTLWTTAQLQDASIETRIESCSDWLRVYLPGKHLVVAGFWTDWDYLNEVLSKALQRQSALSVTVIDLNSADELRRKAGTIWQRLNDLSDHFVHVRLSASDALGELRLAFSRVWVRKFYGLGVEQMEETGHDVTGTSPFEEAQLEDLYQLRQDAEGVPYTKAASLKEPRPNSGQAAFFILRLLSAGATVNGPWLESSGRTVRVVNGAGESLARVRSRCLEQPTVQSPDVTVCAGAYNHGVPARIVDRTQGQSTVRTAPGGTSTWLTLDEAKGAFGL